MRTSQDRHRHDEPRRAGHTRRGRAVPARAVRRPRDHPAAVPGMARAVHRPPAGTQGTRAVRQTIGGGSPILRYTRRRVEGMVERLDRLSPATAPHGFYVAFRYVQPKSDDALRAMDGDGGRARGRVHPVPAILLQHHRIEPQRTVAGRGRAPGFATPSSGASSTGGRCTRGSSRAMTETSARGSSGSTPRSVTGCCCCSARIRCRSTSIDRGDAYPQEVGASVQAVVERLAAPQSLPAGVSVGGRSGPVARTEYGAGDPATGRAGGHKHLLVVPIAFTSDHIETLSELDQEYGEVAHQVGHHALPPHPRAQRPAASSWTRWPTLSASTSRRGGRTDRCIPPGVPAV